MRETFGLTPQNLNCISQVHRGWFWTSLGSPTCTWMSVSECPVNNIKWGRYISNHWNSYSKRPSAQSFISIGLWPNHLYLSFVSIGLRSNHLYLSFVSIGLRPNHLCQSAFGPIIHINRPLAQSFISIGLWPNYSYQSAFGPIIRINRCPSFKLMNL